MRRLQAAGAAEQRKIPEHFAAVDEAEILNVGGVVADDAGVEQEVANGEMVNVEIPEGTRSIGDHAFANCESLQYVSLPHSLELLSRSAFKDSPCDETIQAQQQDILCDRVQP